jgi:hypothetical protein
MKSSTRIFTALLSVLATFSQPAIATYVHADSKININNDLINLGIQNRKKLFGCSQAKPCIMDRIIIEGYKEVFSKDGKLQEVNIVLYNTSFAPAAIEVFSSDKKLKNVEFIDGAKAGFKDLGDYLKTASAGLIAPFQCTTNLFECLSDVRYGIEKNERIIKLQPGDFISISNGSDAAFAYTLALSGIDQVELLASIPGITPSKVKKLSLLKSYSPTLKRKIVEGFIKEKIKEKYTWEMLIKEFGYETYKKPASNPKDLFNNALEVTQNIPQDFLKSMTDGTVTSTAAGDVIDTLIQAASTEGAVFVNATLLVSQSVNSRARYVASELAHKKPYGVFIAGLKNSSTNSDQPKAVFTPNEPLFMPASFTPKQVSPSLKKAIILTEFSGINSEEWKQYSRPFSFVEVDLNNDIKKEIIVLKRPGDCGNRTCLIRIFKLSNQRKSYDLISEIWTSRNLNIALLPTKSNGWQDLAVTGFSHETRTIDWYAAKFDGKTYKSSSSKLTQTPKNIILSEKSPAFDLGDFPSEQQAKPITGINSPTSKPTNSDKSEPLIENSSQVKSVQQVRDQIRGQLNFQKWCDTKGCIAPRTIEVCKLVDVLNSRVSGKIFKPEIKSEKELTIGKSDLQLMRKIWNHCRLVPASDLQIGTKGMLRVYSPQRCKDGNEISQLLRLPSADCSYEKYLSPLKK